jgi:hypothetical protein
MKTPQKKLESNRRYRERNREAVLYHKRNNRLRRFGLEPEDLDKMLIEQDYKCLICGRGPLQREGRGAFSAHIDHCHSCGKVRGLLCKRCNTLLGMIESNEEMAAKILVFYGEHFSDHIALVKKED